MMSRMDLIGTREAAQMLGVSIRSVQLYATSGKLPIAHVAGQTFTFHRFVVERFAESRRIAA